MRPFGKPTLDYLDQSGGVVARLLVTIAARDPATGALSNLAFWSGDEDRSLVVDNIMRTFTSVGGSMNLEPVEYSATLDARRQRLQFVGLPGDVEGLLITLDLHMAPIEIWRVILSPEVAVDTPHRLLKGWIDGGLVSTGAEGQSGRIAIDIASSALALTRKLDRRWSDATQMKRNPGTFVDTPLTITTDGTVAVAAGSEVLGIEAVGGGGGGGAIGGTYSAVSIAGSSGSKTVVKLMDGAATIATWSALGGAGGFGDSLTTTGDPSPMTPAGDGGAGAAAGSNPDFGWAGQQGGGAGQYLNIDNYDVSTLATPQIQVTIGAGGAGNQAGTSGQVILHQLARTGPADRIFQYAAVAGEVNIEWK